MSRAMFFCVVALGLLWLASPVMAADAGKGNILIEEWFTATTGQQVTDNVDTLHAYINSGKEPSRAYWAQKLDRPDAGEDYWGRPHARLPLSAAERRLHVLDVQ